jgi:hypothetical protein
VNSSLTLLCETTQFSQARKTFNYLGILKEWADPQAAPICRKENVYTAAAAGIMKKSDMLKLNSIGASQWDQAAGSRKNSDFHCNLKKFRPKYCRNEKRDLQ